MIRKPKKTSKTTTDNRTYTSSKREISGMCQFCRVHRGCNRRSKWGHHTNWKSIRKNQWKD